MFLSILKTNPGIAKTLLKERKRSCLGIAIYKDIANIPRSIHHFSHYTGMNNVMKIDIPPNNTIRIERGISACCMVLSMKFIFP